jgi:ribosomal protein S18 acetylase RimI-like enzyme
VVRRQKKRQPVVPQFILASLKHLETVLGFIRKYYKFDGIHFSSPGIRSGLEVLLRRRSLGRVWIIRLGQHDTGYIVLTFGYDLEFGGRQATVTEFYILDQFRRLKIGTQALNFVEGFCREMGIGALELQVKRNNTRARVFYKKLGFKSHDRIPLSKEL